jgi:hypothetical protein
VVVGTAIWSFVACTQRYDARRGLSQETLATEEQEMLVMEEESQAKVVNINGLIQEDTSEV